MAEEFLAKEHQKDLSQNRSALTDYSAARASAKSIRGSSCSGEGSSLNTATGRQSILSFSREGLYISQTQAIVEIVGEEHAKGLVCLDGLFPIARHFVIPGFHEAPVFARKVARQIEALLSLLGGFLVIAQHRPSSGQGGISEWKVGFGSDRLQQ